MFRRIRILILLLVLLFVAANQWFDRYYSRDWDVPLRVDLVPINADGSEAAAKSIERENASATTEELQAFFQAAASEYQVGVTPPITFRWAEQVRDLPPTLDAKANVLTAMLWSLRARYWAWRTPQATQVPPDIRLFVLFHDPARSPMLPHSFGAQKGLYAIVHVFAEAHMAGSNSVIMAHELLHTLGATDKYDAAKHNLPRFPEGFAEPQRDPLYPQEFAELMGGRIPTSPHAAHIPESLDEVIIGLVTATEIGWR